MSLVVVLRCMGLKLRFCFGFELDLSRFGFGLVAFRGVVRKYLAVGNGFELSGTEYGFVFWLWSWTCRVLDLVLSRSEG